MNWSTTESQLLRTLAMFVSVKARALGYIGTWYPAKRQGTATAEAISFWNQVVCVPATAFTWPLLSAQMNTLSPKRREKYAFGSAGG